MQDGLTVSCLWNDKSSIVSRKSQPSLQLTLSSHKDNLFDAESARRTHWSATLQPVRSQGRSNDPQDPQQDRHYRHANIARVPCGCPTLHVAIAVLEREKRSRVPQKF